MTFNLELHGRRVLVTGGTKGIGEAVVARLREEGRQGTHHGAFAPRRPFVGCAVRGRGPHDGRRLRYSRGGSA